MNTGFGEKNKKVSFIACMFSLCMLVLICTGCAVKETTSNAENAKSEDVTAANVQAVAVKNTDIQTLDMEDDPAQKPYMIAIDAGHQQKGNTEKEPIGPDAQEMKAKVTDGTRGVVTGLYEYELTLMVSEKLKEELTARGYQVYMVRETHDVNISNAQRALLAYEAGADIFIRIHANGFSDSSVNGAMTICPTPQNPYIPQLYDDSRRLSEKVLEGMTASAGCKKQRVWETDTMSGINWSRIPVTIVEMGYMSNPEEDGRMADEEYQKQLAVGMADGVDSYYEDF